MLPLLADLYIASTPTQQFDVDERSQCARKTAADKEPDHYSRPVSFAQRPAQDLPPLQGGCLRKVFTNEDLLWRSTIGFYNGIINRQIAPMHTRPTGPQRRMTARIVKCSHAPVNLGTLTVNCGSFGMPSSRAYDARSFSGPASSSTAILRSRTRFPSPPTGETSESVSWQSG